MCCAQQAGRVFLWRISCIGISSSAPPCACSWQLAAQAESQLAVRPAADCHVSRQGAGAYSSNELVGQFCPLAAVWGVEEGYVIDVGGERVAYVVRVSGTAVVGVEVVFIRRGQR